MRGTCNGAACRMSKKGKKERKKDVQDVQKMTRGEWDAGVENKNTQNTQINLNKQKLGEPLVYLKPVEQTLYSATVPIKKSAACSLHMREPTSTAPLKGYPCGIGLFYTCDMTHSYVWHDSFVCVKWLTYTCDMTHSYVAKGTVHSHHGDGHLYLCDVTHSYMWHDSFKRTVTHSCEWHDSFVCVTWLIYVCD